MPGKPWVPRFLSDLLDGITLSTDGTFASNSDAKVPTEKAVKSRIDALGAFLPVHDLAGASSDYALAVGETAKLAYSAATSVLLHIDCTAGQVYELTIVGDSSVTVANSGTASLAPNNAAQSNIFRVEQQQLYSSNTISGSHATNTAINFETGLMVNVDFRLTTATKSKTYAGGVVQKYTDGNIYFNAVRGVWSDTTTAWTSLGTIAFPFAQSGTIIIRRIL